MTPCPADMGDTPHSQAHQTTCQLDTEGSPQTILPCHAAGMFPQSSPRTRFHRYRPGPHDVQLSADADPDGDDVPAGHAVHATAPSGLSLSVPAEQSWHTDGSNAPGATENLPISHGWQSADELAPALSVHVPASQGVQRLVPASCCAAYSPNRQAAQSAADVPPVDFAFVEPGHGAHSSSDFSPSDAP